MPTTLNDGGAHSYSSGSYDGFTVESGTSLTIGGATSTGANAHAYAHLPVIAWTDSEEGFAGVLLMDTSTVTVTSGTITGGNGCPGTLDRGDGVADLYLPSYGSAPAIFAAFNTPGGTSYGAQITVSGGTLQGGSYTVGATGSAPMQGSPAIDAYAPASVTISGGSLTGGTSESTMPGAPAVVLRLLGTVGATFGGISSTPTITGGSGVSQGPCVAISNTGSGLVDFQGGIYSGAIALNLASGAGRVRFTIGSDPSPSLTTTAVDLILSDGNRINVAITGASGCTVNITGTYLELVP